MRTRVLILILLCSMAAYPQKDTSGSLNALVTYVVSKMPGMGANAFIVPTNTELSVFASSFSFIASKNYAPVTGMVAAYGYSFYKFYDVNVRDTFYVLKENVPVQRGWGTYIYCASSQNNLMIEIPHPLWDKNTWDVGIRTFLATKARWYSLSGTHRYCNTDSSSDVAHETQTVFYKSHQTIACPLAVQPHGFDGTDATYSGYPDVVISNGTKTPVTLHYTVRDAYVAAGFTAGVFSTSTYSSLNKLGATTNVEGQWSNANGKTFVHIEHDYPLRKDTAAVRKTSNILIGIFSLSNAVTDQPMHAASFTLHQNYPNPFNPSTTIEYSLPEAGNVVVELYNSIGQKIKDLTRGLQLSGTHKITLSAQGLCSGIYLCRVQFQGSQRTIKLNIIK
ncbi:MAG: T9SS type A sorting domain-containing protein [Ignavibacteria bacterium]|nr:T9SS type A sorting domain-containing protein [Ignavibacteria bacterium]